MFYIWIKRKGMHFLVSFPWLKKKTTCWYTGFCAKNLFYFIFWLKGSLRIHLSRYLICMNFRLLFTTSSLHMRCPFDLNVKFKLQALVQIDKTSNNIVIRSTGRGFFSVQDVVVIHWTFFFKGLYQHVNVTEFVQKRQIFIIK